MPPFALECVDSPRTGSRRDICFDIGTARGLIQWSFVEYRALRHLDASNDTFEKSAWMDVWTEAGRSGGFRYRIVAEGGSEYIRSRLFVASLETERKM